MDLYAYVMLERFTVKWRRFRPEFVSEGTVTLTDASMDVLRHALAEHEELMAGRYGDPWSESEDDSAHFSDDSEDSDGSGRGEEAGPASPKNKAQSMAGDSDTTAVATDSKPDGDAREALEDAADERGWQKAQKKSTKKSNRRLAKKARKC